MAYYGKEKPFSRANSWCAPAAFVLSTYKFVNHILMVELLVRWTRGVAQQSVGKMFNEPSIKTMDELC